MERICLTIVQVLAWHWRQFHFHQMSFSMLFWQRIASKIHSFQHFNSRYFPCSFRSLIFHVPSLQKAVLHNAIFMPKSILKDQTKLFTVLTSCQLSPSVQSVLTVSLKIHVSYQRRITCFHAKHWKDLLANEDNNRKCRIKKQKFVLMYEKLAFVTIHEEAAFMLKKDHVAVKMK